MSEANGESVRRGNGKVGTSHHPETDPRREDKNYYGIPPIKHAHWTWQIPIYFWIGGIGAGTHLFSTVAQLLGHEDEALKRASRYTVLVTMILSPVLLIWDLGRPERFYNMMRILKLRSPMSTQSWSLLAFGNLAGLLAARQAAADGLLGRNALSRLVMRLIPARLLAVLALPVRPLRRVQHRQPHQRDLRPDLGPQLDAHGPDVPGLGPLDGPLLALARPAPATDAARRRPCRRSSRREGDPRDRGGPYRRLARPDGPLEQAAVLEDGCPALRRRRAPRRASSRPRPCSSGKETRQKSMLSSLLVLAGGLAFRFALIRAGRISADDPEAYFTFTSGENAPQPEDSV